MPMLARPDHQYIQRHTGRVVTERLFSDRIIHLLYDHARENAPLMFDMLTSRRANDGYALWQYDLPTRRSPAAVTRLIRQLGICLEECLAPATLTSPRRLFERQIKIRPPHIMNHQCLHSNPDRRGRFPDSVQTR